MPRILSLCFLGLLFLFATCSGRKTTSDMTDDELKSYASALAQKFIIVDRHIDLTEVMMEKKYIAGVHSLDTIIHTGMGEFDYTRALKGGLDAPFMSIYIPIEYQSHPDMGKNLADSLINVVKTIANG